MMKSEFEALAKRTVTTIQYKAIETLYIECDLDKYEFVKMIKPLLKSIPEKRKNNRVLVGVKAMPNGTWMTYEAELVDVNIKTGKIEVRRLTENRCWAEVDYDIWHGRVIEV